MPTLNSYLTSFAMIIAIAFKILPGDKTLYTGNR